MHRSVHAFLAAVVIGCAAQASADVDLGFPQQAEHEVKVPPRGPQTGARLYAPEGSGPFPAVVLSHTSGMLQQHIFQWAKRLLDAGYVVLIVDHLRTLSFVDGKHVAQMGLSYGAMAGLRESSKRFRDKNLGGERFAAIVSIYPW